MRRMMYLIRGREDSKKKAKEAMISTRDTLACSTIQTRNQSKLLRRLPTRPSPRGGSSLETLGSTQLKTGGETRSTISTIGELGTTEIGKNRNKILDLMPLISNSKLVSTHNNSKSKRKRT